MATRRNYDEDYMPYRRQSNGPAWTIAMAMIGATVAFGLWLYPDLAHMPGLPEQAKPAGKQAPPAAIRRAPVQEAAPAVQPAIDAYNATAQAEYDAAVVQPPLVLATPVPLPLNSQGEPVISQAQQQQMQLSLQLAEQEGNAAADQALAAERERANANAAQRAPDVSYQEAVELLHRDPCHVPRANPATCAQGLFKPTPVN